MEKNINVRLTLKHDTEENWKKATGFIPKLSEPVIYDEDDVHPYKRYKIGDGVTNVNDLPFERGIGQETVEGGEIFNDYAHNSATGLYSTARGQYTTASGVGAQASGWGTIASGDYSVAMGSARRAVLVSDAGIQIMEMDFGEGHKLYGYFHLEDPANFLIGTYLIFTSNTSGLQIIRKVSTVQGEGAGSGVFIDIEAEDFIDHQETWKIQTLEGSVASGIGSYAGGFNSKASGSFSFAFGQRVNATAAGSAVFGKFNKYDSTAIFTIGNGTSNAPSNAFTVRSDSTNGASIVIGNTAITEAQLQKILAFIDTVEI